MVVANNRQSLRFAHGGAYYVMVKENETDFLIQKFYGGRYDRNLVHPEVKKYLSGA